LFFLCQNRPHIIHPGEIHQSQLKAHTAVTTQHNHAAFGPVPITVPSQRKPEPISPLPGPTQHHHPNPLLLLSAPAIAAARSLCVANQVAAAPFGVCMSQQRRCTHA
jgi:hypothetical protein